VALILRRVVHLRTASRRVALTRTPVPLRLYGGAVIRSQHAVAAPATVVHSVLTDVRAWRLWSPHIARVEAAEQVIDRAGWSGSVKPWFGPATHMDVTWCEPGRGIRWTAAGAGYRLEYADLIEPDGEDSTVTMTAQLHGLAGARRARMRNSPCRDGQLAGLRARQATVAVRISTAGVGVPSPGPFASSEPPAATASRVARPASSTVPNTV
jgi:hypothetical protein